MRFKLIMEFLIVKDFGINRKFLQDLGIQEGNYPASFFEKVKDIKDFISDTEISYCGIQKFCDGKKQEFHIRDVVGTNHQRYVGKSWIEAYFDLDRGNEVVDLYYKNPNYWKEIRDFSKTDLGLIKSNNQYYIFDKAGGGNNRLITMKLMYLSLVAQNQADTQQLDEMFTFSANVREVPKDKDLPYIIFALGEDLDFDLSHSNGIIELRKKFSNEEPIFSGNAEELKSYFLSLFDINQYDKEIVKQRLNSIRRTFGFTGKTYQEKMQQIIPGLREEP